MIDLQYVVLCVSSFVILFHRGRKSGRRKNGKVKGKSKEKHRIKGAEKGGHTRMASPRVRKTAGTPRNRQGENRIMQSCERAVFSPRFLLLLHRTGWEFTCGWCWQHNPLGHQVSAKYRRRIVSWFCPMRRRSLRLLSPGRLHNSDGDTGTFFRVKNYRREFFARKPQARTWKVSSLRVTFSMGLDKGSAAMMDFYRGIWKNAHLAQDNCNHFA